MNDQQKNTLTDVYKKAFRSLLSQELNTGLPAIIEKVQDYKKKKVSVKPLIKKLFLDGRELPLPIIENVPVVYPESDEFIIKPVLKKGMKVWLTFSQRSMDTFLSTGKESNPGTTGKFSLSDAVAFIGFRDFKEDHPLIEDNENFEIIFQDKKIILKDNGDVEIIGGNTITIKSNGDIDIGGGAFRKLLTDDFKLMFNTHVHNFTAAPSGAFSTSIPASITPTPIVGPPVGGAVAGFGMELDDMHFTEKTQAE